MFPPPQTPDQWNSQGISQKPASGSSSFYQIKPDDTFGGVASQNNLDLNTFSSLNAGAKSLPPSGSYVQIKADHPTPATSTHATQQGAYVGQGAYLQGAPTQGQQPSQVQQGSSQSYTGGATVYANRDDLEAARKGVQNMFAKKIQPPTIDFSTPVINPATGTPYSDEFMQLSGYVKDTKSSKWVLTGANGTGGVNPVTGLPNDAASGTFAPNSKVPLAQAYINDKGKLVRTTDTQGNAWDATTATHDIYGGKFIQAGQTVWERSRFTKGNLRQVEYGKGGKKKIVNKHGGKDAAAENAVQAPVIPQAGSTESRSTVLGLHLGSG